MVGAVWVGWGADRGWVGEASDGKGTSTTGSSSSDHHSHHRNNDERRSKGHSWSAAGSGRPTCGTARRRRAACWRWAARTAAAGARRWRTQRRLPRRRPRGLVPGWWAEVFARLRLQQRLTEGHHPPTAATRTQAPAPPPPRKRPGPGAPQRHPSPQPPEEAPTAAQVLVREGLPEPVRRRGHRAAQQQRQLREERLPEGATLVLRLWEVIGRAGRSGVGTSLGGCGCLEMQECCPLGSWNLVPPSPRSRAPQT